MNGKNPHINYIHALVILNNYLKVIEPKNIYGQGKTKKII